VLTERTIESSIKAIVAFLLRQKAMHNLSIGERSDDIMLWREYLPEDPPTSTLNRPFAGSIWSTADVTYSLLGAWSTNEAANTQPNGEPLLNKDFFVKVADSLLAVHYLIQERSNEEFDLIVTSIDKGLIREPKLLKRALRVSVKDLQSYIGMPRSFVVSDAHAEWGTANLGVTALVCRTFHSLLKADLVSPDSKPAVIAFLKKMSDYCSRAELSILRVAIRETKIETDDKRDAIVTDRTLDGMQGASALTYSVLARFAAHLTEVSAKYQLDFAWPKRFHEHGDKEYVSYFAKHLATFSPNKFGPGCLWASGNSFGWSFSSQNLVTKPDPMAVLPALEIIGSAFKYMDPPAIRKILPVLKFGVASFGAFLSLKNDSVSSADLETPVDLSPLKKVEISERWAVEFVARQVVNLTNVLDCFDVSQEQVKDFAGEWSKIASELDACFQCLYTALLIKTYQATIEEHSLPFEAVPQELDAGNEFAHSPGVDISFVAYSLLVGRSRFRPRAARDNYRQFNQYYKKIIGPVAHIPQQLPVTLPIYRTLLDRVCERVLTAYELGTEDSPMAGGFLSSYSDPKHGQYRATVYTWATAHALLALCEWKRQNPSTNNAESKAQLQESLHHNEVLMNLGSYVAGFGLPAIDDENRGRLSKYLVAGSLILPLVAFSNLGSACSSTIQDTLSLASWDWGRIFTALAKLSVASLLAVAVSIFLFREYRWLLKALKTIEDSIERHRWCAVTAGPCRMKKNAVKCVFSPDARECCIFHDSQQPSLSASVRAYSWTYILLLVLVLFASAISFQSIDRWISLIPTAGWTLLGFGGAVLAFLLRPFVSKEKIVGWLRPLRVCWNLLTGTNDLLRIFELQRDTPKP
jgi:hypothetical protein